MPAKYTYPNLSIIQENMYSLRTDEKACCFKRYSGETNHMFEKSLSFTNSLNKHRKSKRKYETNFRLYYQTDKIHSFIQVKFPSVRDKCSYCCYRRFCAERIYSLKFKMCGKFCFGTFV